MPSFLARVFPIALSVVWVLLDQWLKAFSVASAPRYSFNPDPYANTLNVVPGFLSLGYTENRGAAWGMLSGNSLPLSILRLGVAGYILFYLFTNPRLPLINKIALGLIAGGAIGNGIDGVSRGYVVDMLVSHWLTAIYKPLFGTVYPIFNLADVGVVSGVILLLVASFLPQAKTSSVAG